MSGYWRPEWMDDLLHDLGMDDREDADDGTLTG